MKKECKVSIIMPSLNVTEYIDECIQSVLSQTLSEKEIICVDAGSTDGTWEKLLSYAEKPEYKEHMLLLKSNVRSYGYQINLALHSAVGEYIGIVETDDFVDRNMYEQLYTIGLSANADFVKADYDTFVTYSEDKRFFRHVTLFKDKNEKYGKVLNPSKDLYLYTNDQNIWKGIYRRQFLINHRILLNESNGAAFQDIGFMQQVLSTAKRAVYIDKSFYRYRMDREESSINSPYGLKYSYWEFSRLLVTPEIREKLIYMDGIFAHMAQSFCCELTKSLRILDYDTNSEYISPYYIWFKEQISNAIKNHLLDIDLYQLYPQLHAILKNVYEFSSKLKSEDLVFQEKKEKLLNAVHGKRIIIFGIGSHGLSAVRYLHEHNINVVAACDNNNTLWYTQKYGLPVYSPLECIQKFPNGIYIIAIKKSNMAIFKQLINMGINQTNIFIYP